MRSTVYDRIAGCYKIKPEMNVNIIQELGQLEELKEKLLSIVDHVGVGDYPFDEGWMEVVKIMEEVR